ncbi:conjugal transfer protein TraD (plasmid) [Sphingomonas sp. AP4-R1]|uniref:conjugal transfer protein TraD n=1 Tax=Sphingomonas sp. AP4-R1 TaxID=2735134 RepID=UPI0014934AC2|nr:conjugal transfer protein TraD [Sphingomonas sp. AP4-R1]QJU60958.1 conjugal transfer protein TraD [Sphingomonas sp. AP4-R1]
MRKVRDYDAELKALNDKARALKAQKIQQLGELVAATGADALDTGTLVGGLLHILKEAKAPAVQEAWRSDGAAFFQRRGRKASGSSGSDGQGAGAGRASDAQS